MMDSRRFSIGLCLVGALAALPGCERNGDPAATLPSAAADVALVPTPSAPVAPPAGFDLTTLPVSTVPLGEFPYFTLPAGYASTDKGPNVKDFARFPFRVDGTDRWIEGRFYSAAFKAEDGKTFFRL